MHQLPAELFAENLSVLLISKHEHLVVFVPPSEGVSVPRERKFPILANLRSLWKFWPVHCCSGSATQWGQLLSNQEALPLAYWHIALRYARFPDLPPSVHGLPIDNHSLRA
jgi:hypothetical protein